MIKKTLLLVASFLTLQFPQLQAQLNVGLKTVDVNADGAIDDQEIEKLAYQVLNAEKESQRLEFNQLLKERLRIECSKEEAFAHPFAAVKSLSILSPKDSAFRIFNWNIPKGDGSFDYECAILKKSEESDFFFLTKADDQADDFLKVQTEKNQWFPGLVYEIIQKETLTQSYYTLLVWDGNNRLTTKKRIDALWFDREGAVRFGAPIFKHKSETLMRDVFEYSSQNTMTLSYNEELDRIEFDHLSPPSNNLSGIYEYYGPDLSYDAYQWENNAWLLQEDIDMDKGLKKSKKDFEVDKKVIQKKPTFYQSK